VEADRDQVPVAARGEELRQVILNLIDNSRQAGAQHVKVVIGRRSLTVIDDGRGIPADQIDRLFEPTFSTTTSGTGLGLAIVRRLVEGWGATISVSSRLGEGTSFTLSFPATGTPGAA
jgi:signal transduction histidine kinase